MLLGGQSLNRAAREKIKMVSKEFSNVSKHWSIIFFCGTKELNVLYVQFVSLLSLCTQKEPISKYIVMNVIIGSPTCVWLRNFQNR